eukprot:15632-Pleurochrysis_carterae.AAC.3
MQRDVLTPAAVITRGFWTSKHSRACTWLMCICMSGLALHNVQQHDTADSQITCRDDTEHRKMALAHRRACKQPAFAGTLSLLLPSSTIHLSSLLFSSIR